MSESSEPMHVETIINNNKDENGKKNPKLEPEPESAPKSEPKTEQKIQNQSLYLAVENNDTHTALEMMFEQSTAFCDFVDPSNESKWTMLHWAAYHGNEMVNVYIDPKFIFFSFFMTDSFQKCFRLGCDQHCLACRGFIIFHDCSIRESKKIENT